MPFADLTEVRIHYSLAGPDSAPVLVFSNSLGADLSMWDAQTSAFENNFRVLRYDTRGHGRSSVPPGPYNVATLGRDFLALLDSLALDRVYFCGLSLGGQTAQWLGLNASSRFHKLILCNTAAKIGTDEIWNTRIATVLRDGTESVAPGVIGRWFTAGYRAAHPEEADRAQRMLEATSAEGYVACCAAVRDFDSRASVAQIRLPVLVIAGAQDPSTSPEDGRFLASQIPNAQFAELDAAHLSNIEQSEKFNQELADFLQS